MDKIHKSIVRRHWLSAFEDLQIFGPPHTFSTRKLAGLYAVASICYHENEVSLVPDQVFDELCKWLLSNYRDCISEGANKLDVNLLKCNSGYDMTIFVKPYHDITAVLLRHYCRCYVCNRTLTTPTAPRKLVPST